MPLCGKISVLQSHSLEKNIHTVYLVQLGLGNQNPDVCFTDSIWYPEIPSQSLQKSSSFSLLFAATSSILHNLYINIGWSEIHLTSIF